ncbi:hypothetical protein PR048_020029 [Dryococelus australis]|uniref:DDE Tnp4 domain-containing protein n=1 Tax=Dryococelus australis TaxID=614101 RepID=A0ABQ9H550_9NEOP|nr:hypothetical protein PR048_020029 [Dryococelus australis]
MKQLLLTLRFYATGGYLTTMGDMFSVHKTTTRRIIKKVSAAAASLRPQYIHLPHTNEELAEVQHGFHQIPAFPRVFGTLDCTHVRIKSPGGEVPEGFRNRNGYFPINCQTVSDHQLLITDIVARWSRSTYDMTIFNNSVSKARLERGDFGNGTILCVSGYAVGRRILPPLGNPATPEDHLYNESLTRTRNTVERQYGVLKARFPVLALGIRLHLDHVNAVIVAYAVIHNTAIGMREDVPPVDREFQNEVNMAIVEGEIPVINDEIGPEAVRHTFVDYFRRLR